MNRKCNDVSLNYFFKACRIGVNPSPLCLKQKRPFVIGGGRRRGFVACRYGSEDDRNDYT